MNTYSENPTEHFRILQEFYRNIEYIGKSFVRIYTFEMNQINNDIKKNYASDFIETL